MRIAFDLDDTLIPGKYPFPTEPMPRGLLAWWLHIESLRLGTVALFQDLWRAGHDVCIYTTSLRKPLDTRLAFYAHGTWVSRVVNDDLHRREMAQLGGAYRSCTKFPPAFGIDVLIDDSEGVLIEARRYGFQVISIQPEDEGWTERIRRRLRLC